MIRTTDYFYGGFVKSNLYDKNGASRKMNYENKEPALLFNQISSSNYGTKILNQPLKKHSVINNVNLNNVNITSMKQSNDFELNESEFDKQFKSKKNPFRHVASSIPAENQMMCLKSKLSKFNREKASDILTSDYDSSMNTLFEVPTGIVHIPFESAFEPSDSDYSVFLLDEFYDKKHEMKKHKKEKEIPISKLGEP